MVTPRNGKTGRKVKHLMGFLDDVKAETPTRIGGVCSVATWLEAVSVDVASDFRAVLADRSIPATTIHKVMQEKHGFPASPTSLQRHRRHECHCS